MWEEGPPRGKARFPQQRRAMTEAKPRDEDAAFLNGTEAMPREGDPAFPDGAAPGKSLAPAARRALEEAAARRVAIDERAAAIARQKEHQGRGGLEPVRYEDWEVKGLAADF